VCFRIVNREKFNNDNDDVDEDDDRVRSNEWNANSCTSFFFNLSTLVSDNKKRPPESHVSRSDILA